MISSYFSYYNMVDFVNGLAANVFAWQVDLFSAPPVAGPWNLLSDGTLVTNPGVTSKTVGTSGIVYPDGTLIAEDVDMYPAIFSGTDIVGTLPVTVNGWVVSDGSSNVLGWGFWGPGVGPIVFNLPTDTLELDFTAYAESNY